MLDPANLFSQPKMPAVPVAPEAPELGDKAVQKAAEEERRKRAGMGRASTVLTGAGGLSEEGKPGARVLLGAGA